MKVVKYDDVVAGMKRLGVECEFGRTKVKEWTRLHIHIPQGKDIHGNIRPTLYIARVSFHHNLLNSYKMFGLPDYYAHAIRIMLTEAVIVNHINYYALGVKAYNETLHLKDEAEALKGSKKHSAKVRAGLVHKAMLKFYYEKQKLFTSLLKERYSGISKTKDTAQYAL